MITADPNQRFGNHVVMTITLPEHFVVLQHHGQDVKILVSALRSFAERVGDDPANFRFHPPLFNWREGYTLREEGWAVGLPNGTLWPTSALVSAVREWDRMMGIG